MKYCRQLGTPHRTPWGKRGVGGKGENQKHLFSNGGLPPKKKKQRRLGQVGTHPITSLTPIMCVSARPQFSTLIHEFDPLIQKLHERQILFFWTGRSSFLQASLSTSHVRHWELGNYYLYGNVYNKRAFKQSI